MAQDAVLRRLSAILAADVVGYSRLMAADETDTLARFRQIRAKVIDPTIAQFQGSIVGTAGDSLLVEFTNAMAAVECAVACQRELSSVNAAEPEDRRISFRMGVNLGDVIAADGTIHGDGVNVAARLEKLADPGGLCIARNVFEQVESKLKLNFTDLGEHQVKNISKPIRVYRIEIADKPKSVTATGDDAKRAAHSEKVSIAILPFTNMSGDKEEDYFSDGITEDIITEISRFRELRVIARNSSFAFRGQNVDVGEVGRKLGVQFVVEGSVRKAGNRLRITAQLIEAETDRHVWAERYDRSIDDIFSTQDEIARTVATLAAGHVRTAAAARSRTRPTESLSAYDLLLRARAMQSHYGSHKESEALLARAITLDRDYATAHAMMSNNLALQSEYDRDMERLERAADFARRAIKLDPDEPWGYCALGYCLSSLRRVPEAGVHFERATQLNPNDVYIAMYHALWFLFMGRIDEAIARMQEGVKRDPFGHEWFWDVYSCALVLGGKYREAIAAYEKMTAPAPWTLLYAAIAHVNLGDLASARSLISRYRQSDAKLSPEQWIGMDCYVDRQVIERLLADLRKAL